MSLLLLILIEPIWTFTTFYVIISFELLNYWLRCYKTLFEHKDLTFTQEISLIIALDDRYLFGLLRVELYCLYFRWSMPLAHFCSDQAVDVVAVRTEALKEQLLFVNWSWLFSWIHQMSEDLFEKVFGLAVEVWLPSQYQASSHFQGSTDYSHF